MSLAIQTGVRLAQDMQELSSSIWNADAQFARAAYSPEARAVFVHGYATKFAATQLLTKQLYDISHGPEAAAPSERATAGELGGMALLLSDMIDDQIDNPAMPLEEKFQYLDDNATCVFEGKRPLTAEIPEIVPPYVARATFDLATRINIIAAAHDGEAVLKDVLNPLIDDVKAQFLTTDVREQLGLVKRIGEGCAALATSAVQVVDRNTDAVITQAGDGIGGYAQCLDNAYEIEEDMREDAMSYATVFLREHGDTRPNRRIARNVLRQMGQESLAAGAEGLTLDQAAIYGSMQKLLALKYRVLQQAKNAVLAVKK